MDINPRHLVTASILSDHFEQVPLTASPDFCTALYGTVQEHGVDTYLPLLPEEVVLGARLLKAEKLPGDLVLLAGSADAGEIAADKWATAQWLARHKINGPKTTLAMKPFEADRYFLKPRSGTGSRRARTVLAADLASAIQGEPSAWVLQEICEPPEVTVDVFFDPEAGFCTAIGRERIEIKAGVSTKARLFYDEKLRQLSERIAVTLAFAGSFCFQVMRVNGEWGVIDINLRPGAATAMCNLTGNDFFAATFARAWREDYSRFFRPLEQEVFVTRQYAEFITG
jgi:predicted ATP-grasp superfamily ATP-dependent carboligase